MRSDRMLAIVPSRGRPDRLRAMIASFEATTSLRTDLLVVIDADERAAYDLWIDQASTDARLQLLVLPQMLMVPKINEAVRWRPGYGWYAFLGDDHHPRTSGWDITMTDALDRTGLAYGNDLLQGENMATAVVMTGDIPAALGFMAPPVLDHLFCDNYWMALGRGLGNLVWMPEVVIEHVHYLTGAVEKDATYLIGNNQERWVHDEAAYRAWERDNLTDDIGRVREQSNDITVLITTDGRTHYLDRTIASFESMVTGSFAQLLIHDDSGDPAVHNSIRLHAPDWGLVTTPGRSGFAGSRRHAWDHLRRHCQSPWVFMLEDDFTFNRPVDLGAMLPIMRRNQHLTQMAFRRQGWNGPEIEAGGVVELRPDEFEDHSDVVWDLDQPVAGTDTMTLARRERWLEHRLFWTSNPSLFRLRLTDNEWPDGLYSEAEFCNRIFTEHPEWRSGYWGPRTDGPWVHHIGDERHDQAWGY